MNKTKQKIQQSKRFLIMYTRRYLPVVKLESTFQYYISSKKTEKNGKIKCEERVTDFFSKIDVITV